MNGKGSRQRPRQVDARRWSENYERTFGKSDLPTDERLPCAYCGDLCDGEHKTHRDGPGTGPLLPICDRCWQRHSNTKIWRKISKAPPHKHVHDAKENERWRLKKCQRLARRKLAGAEVTINHVCHTNGQRNCYAIVTDGSGRDALTVKLADLSQRIEPPP